MTFNTRGGVELPLEVFGSWVTEMAPIDLPKGVSPDNQEMAFVPGNAGTRAALQKVFSTPFPAGGPLTLRPTVVSGHSYVLPNGNIQNLYYDSNGTLWMESLTTPGAYTQLLQSTPGTYAKFCSAFGRVYIAISDGLHGQDVPYQYDGTFIDRVTQDGPGAPPVVSSIVLPSSQMAPSTSVPGQTIASINSSDLVSVYKGPVIGYVDYYTTFTVNLAPGSALPNIGDIITITGNTEAIFNQTNSAIAILGPLTFKCGYWSTVFLVGTGGTMTPGSANTIVRANNLVTVNTATPHGLQQGYQAQITKVPPAVVGATITSIVIDNETSPGLATVTTSQPHGLLPGNAVNMTAIVGAAVGGGISNVALAGQIATITTASAHGLQPGAVVNLAVVTNGKLSGQYSILATPSATAFTFIFADLTDIASVADTGAVTLSWPLIDNAPGLNYFTVQTAPTPTTFTVPISYVDGTWTGGTISFGWTGTFYVLSVPSATSFTYQQYGPNASSTSVGTVTPYGQCAPGLHFCQLLWQNRQGGISVASPPTSFEASGGQYVSVTGIALAPSNIVSRILAFSGAQPNVPGERPPMFYLPIPANVSGIVVSTATAINDNLTTSLVLDFSDNSLFTGIGISVPGNNLRTNFKLDGALGFGFWSTRLLTWGQRNAIANLLSMGFGGGNLSGSGIPLGWTVPATSVGGAYTPGTWGGAWAVSASAADTAGTSGLIQQGAYQDGYGNPILTGNTLYKVRFQVNAIIGARANLSFTFFISSASSGFSTLATVSAATLSAWQASNGAWLEATFDAKTAEAIPADAIFGFYAQSASGVITFQTTEWSLIYAQTPYREGIAYASYGNNPEGMDALSGKFGPSEDSNKIMDMAYLRRTLYLVTQDPSGRLHETDGSSVTEPSGWVVDETDANCGALSAFCLTKSQADDSSASGGEEWMAWASESGARIFGGGTAHKISQEIQSAWSGLQQVTAWPQINMRFATAIQAVNDPVERVIYFFLPVGSYTAGDLQVLYQTPSQVYPVNYRELDTAEQIAGSPPYHPSLSGRLIATDNTRKWTHWLRTLNGAARMYRQAGQLTMTFFAGNGNLFGTSAGFGNVYTLNPAQYTDDDFGQIASWYVTYAFPAADEEQALQLGSHLKMLAYFIASVAGIGQINITPLLGNLGKPSRLICTRNLSTGPAFDLEWTGASVLASRMFFKFQSSPLTGQTDNAFSLEKCIPVMRTVARMPVRGSAH